jgi:sialate O-acetylesterase
MRGYNKLNDEVYRRLNDEIMDLTLEPGVTVSVQKLASAFGVSRTPVREAIIRLQKKGLVNIYPQSGTVISRISLRRITQERFLRKTLEISAVEPFLQNCNNEVLLRMEELIDSLRNTRPEDYRNFFTADNEFHHLIFETAGQSLSWETICDVVSHYNRFRILSTRLEGINRGIIQEHEAILRAARQGDKDAMCAALERHLGKLKRETKLLLELFPDYFILEQNTPGTDVEALGKDDMTDNASAPDKFRLPAIISDGMVLQRDSDAVVWGWDKPGQRIQVRFRGSCFNGMAGFDGKWSISLGRQEAGGPFPMEIIGSETASFAGVFVGDVWLCSGQSNMELPVARVFHTYPETAHANNPYIREFHVPINYAFDGPCEDTLASSWKPLNPENVMSFSAIGYFFANRLFEDYHVPVGIIAMAVGGAHVEAWMSRKALADRPARLRLTDLFKDESFRENLLQSELEREQNWQQALDAADPGLNEPDSWYSESFDDSAWPSFELPQYLSEGGLPEQHGSFWFRRTVEIPEEFAGKPAELLLGRIVDADTAYVNGINVGTTGYQYPPRRYSVPEGVLKAGKNTVAVRLVSFRGKPGFITEKPYELRVCGRTFPLTGTWKCHVGAPSDMLPEKVFLHEIPTSLFNAMFSPISACRIKGVLWYQGESNTWKPASYSDLFQRMIGDWRETLVAPELPFLFVQLPNYLERESQGAKNRWAELREAQADALRLPNTAMVIAIDVGEWNDLHPVFKHPVAERLELAARKLAYGEKTLAASGPIFDYMEVEGKSAVLYFKETGSGLISRDGEPLRGFEMSGPGGVYFPAQARIENNTVVLTCPQINVPVNVRYAWCDSPENVNFYNREGLPAAPFRTERE